MSHPFDQQMSDRFVFIAFETMNRETIPARVINLTNILINLYESSNESSLPVSIILENKLEIKYLVGELSCRPNQMSCRLNVCRWKVLSVKHLSV
jgi:hypothetical protein